MGKKPFSAKAKREQLRQKRQAHSSLSSGPASLAPAVQASPISSNNPSTNAPSPASTVQASPRRSRSARPNGNAHRYRLIFAADTDAARKRQRAMAHVPVVDPEQTVHATLANRTMDIAAVRPFPDPAFAMPRRPPWTYKDTLNVVNKRELASFREWIDRVARLDNLLAAYFEGNLETWRQLWRVIERSDVLVLVADIRFPALHFVPDLYHYVTEDLGKGMVLALNKCDLVPADVLLAWKRYFETHYSGMAIAMFSSFPDAKLAPSKDNSELLSKRELRMARSKLSAWGADQLLAAVDSLDLEPRKKAYLEQWRAKLDHNSAMTSDDEDGTDINFLEQSLRNASDTASPPTATTQSEALQNVQLSENKATTDDASSAGAVKPKAQRKRRRRAKSAAEKSNEPSSSKAKSGKNGKEKKATTRMYKDTDDNKLNGSTKGGHPNLIGESETESNPSEVRFELDEDDVVHENMITIGVVGHPNAGKSSMINGVFRKKVVSTSRTPGHTKHLQTIFLSDSVRLCDCPGLVFPGLASRELQILAGMYPIAQVREPYAAVKYLADRVPLVRILNLETEIKRLEVDMEEPGYISSTGWTAWKICEAWAMKRGFRTAKAARLDVFRAANNILRLALDGRIVLATVPAGYTPEAEVPMGFAHEVTWDVHDDADASVVSASGKVEAVLSGSYGDHDAPEHDADEEGDEDGDEDGAGKDEAEEEEDQEQDQIRGNARVSENAFSLLEEVC